MQMRDLKSFRLTSVVTPPAGRLRFSHPFRMKDSVGKAMANFALRRSLALVLVSAALLGALLVATVQAQTPPSQDDKSSSGSEAESLPLPTPTPVPQDGPEDSASAGGPRGTASDPTITIAAYSSPVTEGGTVYFRFTASSAPSAHVEINISATGGTSFLTATPVSSIGLGPGLTVAWLILGTENDNVDEPDETITATIMTGTGYSVGSPSSATITIQDNDEDIDSSLPSPPTSLSISIEAGDDNDLDVTYTRSVSPHYYEFELHRSATQNGSYSLTATVNDSSSPANFDDQTKGYWYKARGRNCQTSSRTGCGDWSAWSNSIELPTDSLDPPTNLSIRIEAGDDNDLDVTYTRSVSPHNYEFELHRSATQNGSYSLTATVNDSSSPANFDDQTKGYWYKTRGRNCQTSSRTGCGDWSAWSNSIELPTDTPSIEIRNLATALREGQSENFLVWASSLNTAHRYTIRVETDNSDIGFNATCLSRTRRQFVPSYSISESAGYTLHGCHATGGRVTATLLRGSTSLVSDYQDVTVLPPVFQFTPGPLALGGTSSVWTVPTGVTSVYVDVSFSQGFVKNSDAGDININRVNSSGTVLSTLAVDNENDNGTLTGVAAESLIRIDVDSDAFDDSLALVTLTFHSGSNATGLEIARATVQKESKPYAPTNGRGSVNETAGSVTLSWGPGAARLGSNPDHYEVVIPDATNPLTPLYSNLNVDDSANPTTLTISSAGLGIGTHTAEVRHCNAAGGCSLPLAITFMLTVFQFTPSPLALGGTSNVWTIPTGVTGVYVHVDFSEGIFKDSDSGDININRVNSSGTVLSTLAVDNENDSGTLPGATAGSLVRIDVDNDAFDVSLALVTLTFHSGSDATGPVKARATVQKESRPYAPTNGSASVVATDGSVTLSWGPGAARLGSNPDHYEVVVVPGAYSNSNVAARQLRIANGWSEGFAGAHSAEVRHCNAAGGCSMPLTIPFVQPPFGVSLRGDRPFGQIQWGLMQNIDASISGAPGVVTLSDYSFRIKAPAGTGIQARTSVPYVCDWPTQVQPWTNEYSAWVPAADTVPLVRCGLGDGATNIQVWLRHNASMREFQDPSYEFTVLQSLHRVDEEVTHANVAPLVSGATVSSAQLTMFVESIDSAVAAWNAVAGGATFTKVLLTATPDVAVEGYVTHLADADAHCGSSVACTVNISLNYPHLGRQTLYFEQPPFRFFNGMEVEHMWTNDVALVGDAMTDYMPAVMMHEFGHTAGLGHSAWHQDVMGYARDKSALSSNDKRAMKEIYESHVAP